MAKKIRPASRLEASHARTKRSAALRQSRPTKVKKPTTPILGATTLAGATTLTGATLTGATGLAGGVGVATGVTGTTGAAGGTGGPAGSVALPFLATRQRILSTVDPLGTAGSALSLVSARTTAVANLFLGMQQVRGGLQQLGTVLSGRSLPAQIIGVLLEPDGSPARLLQVQFNPSTLGGTGTPVTVQTDDSGTFQMNVPPGIMIQDTSSMTLQIHGSNGNATVSIPAAQIAANGLVGSVALPQFIYPLPVSILAALQALVPPPPASTQPQPLVNPAQLPVVKIGDNENDLLQYGANNSVDRFPYSVFFRLVEPRASIVTMASTVQVGNRFTFLPQYLTDRMTTLTVNSAIPTPAEPARSRRGQGQLSGVPAVRARAGGIVPGPATPPAGPSAGTVSYVDRVPVEQPLSVDGFREQIMGLQPNGTFTGDETVPMAGTLGLGYMLNLSQRWTFQGLTLGDLVYSLPLAPGEQQQVAIFERTDTSQVSESEFFSEEEYQQQTALADTSTQATFNSAFSEAMNGSSSFQTQSDSSSWGGSLILISGGGGSSSSSGTSSQALQGQRDTNQQAAQTTHSAAENQAAARRTAARTGMRIATASEAQSVTTKTITNHNHTRALTMQYWEVLRLYDVTTAIDGLQLCCLVPLQVVRFMPPGQPLTITDPASLGSRAAVMARYNNIIKHADVLTQALPRRFVYGLTLLQQFASDPTATVDVGGVAEDVIQFTLTGTFLPCEDVFITAITDRNTRVGPAKLANTAAQIPVDTFATQEQLTAWLAAVRQGGGVSFTGALALPPTMNRNNIVGFEISRTFRQLTYTLLSPEMLALNELNTLFGAGTWINQAIESTFGQDSKATARATVTMSPSDLQSAVGGPLLYQFQAGIQELQGNTLTPVPSEQYANDSLGGIELPQQPYPVPALQLGPVLRYKQLLEIEKMAQHLVRNTVQFSRAIWASMSADERAILLEAYTIGVPPGGVTDASQMVPLLNCVENRVLGYFGNSMILPFIIPDVLAQASSADGEDNSVGTLDPNEIQSALLAYHQAAFQPPRSTIALPTHGVLGEGVLGHSPSAEKIDLTRFWNWQDSPSDTAPAISPVTLPTSSPSLTAGLTAPNSLTQLPSLINNVLTAPAPNTSLLQALGTDAANQQDFSSSLTGAAQLSTLLTNAQNNANAARSDALNTTKTLTSQAMATVGNIVGGMKGNPTAGSTAASAAMGQGSGAQGNQGAGAGPGAQGNKATGTTGNTATGTGKTGGGPGGGPGGTGTGTGGTGTGTGGTGTGGTGTGGTGTGGTGTGTGGTGTGGGPAPPGPGG